MRSETLAQSQETLRSGGDFNPKKGSPAEKIQTQLKELYEKNKSSAAK